MPQKPVENGIEVAGGLNDQLQHLWHYHLILVFCSLSFVFDRFFLWNTFFSPLVSLVVEVITTGVNWSIFFCKSCFELCCYCQYLYIFYTYIFISQDQHCVGNYAGWVFCGNRRKNKQAAVSLSSWYWPQAISTWTIFATMLPEVLTKSQTFCYMKGELKFKWTDSVHSNNTGQHFCKQLSEQLPEVELGYPPLLTFQKHPGRNPKFGGRGPEHWAMGITVSG